MNLGGPPLAGKVALVTGAGRGLGRALALALAEAGAGLALAGRDPADLEEVGRLARARGGHEVLVQPADVTEPAQVAALAEAAHRACGGLDIVVHAAGAAPPGGFLDSDPERVREMVAGSLWGAYLVTRACLPLMAGRGGDVVFLAMGPTPAPGWGMLGAVRQGVAGLAEALRREVGEDQRWAGVRVLTVRLGAPLPAPPERAALGLTPLPSERRAGQALSEAARRIALALTHPPEVAVRELVVHAGEETE